ncbi:MAG: hypothetical protein ABI416_16290 [Ginsengibacter sp.]
MATIDKNQNDIISAWQSLIEQSVKANTSFLEESARIFTDLISKKTDPKDLLKINTDVLNSAVNNFIKLTVTNSENLMKFGVTVSRSFFSFGDTKTGTDSPCNDEAEKPIEPVAPAPRNEINLSVKQGEKITTSFYLNSHNAFAQNGNFYFGNFIDSAGSTGALSMAISPKEFILEPAKSLKVDISIDAANGVAPGKYKSTVRLDGMDNQEFDIVVDVAESVSPITKLSKRTTVIKKAIAKKPSPKKKGKK